jgi:hypothetical protein
MMKRLPVLAVLLLAGVALADTVARRIGWFAAVAFTPEAARAIASAPAIANIVYLFGMAALPALIISMVAGLLLIANFPGERWAIVTLVALPWLLDATVGGGPQPERLSFMLGALRHWQVWPPLLAVPLVLWLATLAGPLRPHHADAHWRNENPSKRP